MNKIVQAWNKVYGSFLKDLKTTGEETRAIIKKHYKVIDKSSEEYVKYFMEDVDDAMISEFLEMKVGNGIIDIKRIASNLILSQIAHDGVINDTILSYLYILLALGLVWKDGSDILFMNVITCIGKIQSGENIESLIEDILDDDIKNVLIALSQCSKQKETSSEDDGSKKFNNMFENIDKTLFGSIAKEISEDIDVSDLKLDKPEDILKMMDFSSSNNIVGDIIKKVSSRIHEKIGSGELKHEDLFKEAMGMMGSMGSMGGGGGSGSGGGSGGGAPDIMNIVNSMGGIQGLTSMLGNLNGLGGLTNNPMFSEMMKGMKSGKAVPRNDVISKASTRERLRAKYNERSKDRSSSTLE